MPPPRAPLIASRCVSPVAGQLVSYVCTSREQAEHAGTQKARQQTAIMSQTLQRMTWSTWTGWCTAGTMHVSHV